MADIAFSIIILAALGSCTYACQEDERRDQEKIVFRATCQRDGYSADDCAKFWP